jgi:hypothetical protein
MMEAILQIIGLGTVLFLIFYFIARPAFENKEKNKEEFDVKLRILRKSHPYISSLFDEFENKQYRSQKILRVEGEKDKGFYTKIFGILIFVYHQFELDEFKNLVISEMKRLEGIPNEKSRIEEIIKKSNQLENRLNEIKESKYLEKHSVYLKYKDDLNAIFPNSATKIKESELLIIINERFGITTSQSDEILKKWTNQETGVIFNDNKVNGQEVYWYCESILTSKIRNRN